MAYSGQQGSDVENTILAQSNELSSFIAHQVNVFVPCQIIMETPW